MPAPAFFDVWVIGPLLPPQHDRDKRAALLRRIEASHAIAHGDGAQFVAGARLCVQAAIAEEVAVRVAGELQALGASVTVEQAVTPDEQLVAPDEAALALDDSLMAKLQSIDGDDSDVAPPPPPRAEPLVAPATGDVDDARFRPTHEAQAMHLEIEKPVLPPAPPPSTVSASDDEGAPAPRGAPVDDEPDWQPVPGRIAAGALRKQPAARIAIGLVAGLFVGWLFAQPYAHRAERHVAELRAQADAERYRPVDEAQARVRALDREADDTASSGALGMAVIWLVVGGGAFAAWWRLT